MANNETMRPALMASESVQSYLVSIKYKANDEYAEIHDGALVKLGALVENDPYNMTRNGDTLAGAIDYNVYEATAPAAATDKVVIVDLAEVPAATNGDLYYKMGIRLYGLVAPAGLPVRARIPMQYDKYWLSNDCFVGDVEVGKFATPTANDTHHTVVDAAVTTGYCVAIEASRDFIAGNSLIGTLYLCRVL